ncbi:MAG TPA: Type 1 glutamine amidotransferase-like domain-containing protein [Candidatus Limnocylindrales bacterium]|nr:Type 1 glutamine amidotransferase-like domain-containing protein [Candidatus Limnocylindrales bacterium]
MTGAIALVGSGEFSSLLGSFDRALLAATGRARPRVALLLVAARPNGDAGLARTGELGREHFAALGAEVELVSVRDRSDADDPARAQAVGEADVIYLCGAHPEALQRTLAGSAVERVVRAANERGTIVVGGTAGAAVLADWRLRQRGPLRLPLGWVRGMGLVSGAAVAAAYDRLPEALRVVPLLRAPEACVVLGIDRETALVGRDGTWQVHGAGRVTVWHGRRRTRHRAGETINL